MSSSATSTPIQHVLYDDGDAASDEQPHQVLEIRMRYFICVIAGVSNIIVEETASIPVRNAVFRLPLQALNDDPVSFQIHIAQSLSSLNINSTSSEVIAGQIVSYVLQIPEEDREMNLRVVAVVDNVRHTSTPPFPVLYPVPIWLGGTAMVEEEAPPETERFRMEKLEETNGEEDLRNCSICLDELNCNDNKREVVKIPCGHVYHESCIFKWLLNSNSCPLCRRPVPLQEVSH